MMNRPAPLRSVCYLGISSILEISSSAEGAGGGAVGEGGAYAALQRACCHAKSPSRTATPFFVL